MIINTRPEEVSKKIIELCEQEKIESRHVHMSRIEFLSGSKKTTDIYRINRKYSYIFKYNFY